MADTTKKQTKSSANTKAVKIDTTAAMPELEKQLMTKQQDYSEAQRSHKSGELVNPRVLSSYRRDIARLKTAIRAQELTKEEK